MLDSVTNPGVLDRIPIFSSLSDLLHSEWPKLYGVLAVLSAIGLN